MLAIVALQEDGTPIVRVLPITHTPPSDPAVAIEIPAAVKQRLRLDHERSWIVLTESNRFAWPGPDVRPLETKSGYYGHGRLRCSPRLSAGSSQLRKARRIKVRRARPELMSQAPG